MSSTIPHTTCGGDDGRTSRSATPQIDMEVWIGRIKSGRLEPGRGRIGRRRPKPGRAGLAAGGFPLVSLTQLDQLANETSEGSYFRGCGTGSRSPTRRSGADGVSSGATGTACDRTEGSWERDENVQLSNRGSKNCTASVAIQWKERVRLAMWSSTPHRRRGCLPKAAGQWSTRSQTP